MAASTLLESNAPDSSDTPNISQLPDSSITANLTEPIDPASTEESVIPTPDLPTSADDMIESAVENVISETVPPIVEAPVSDLREDISPLTREPSEGLRQPSLPASDKKDEESIIPDEQPSENKEESHAPEELVTTAEQSAIGQPSAPDGNMGKAEGETTTGEQPVVEGKGPSDPMQEDIKDETLVDDMNLTFDAPRPDIPPSSPNNAAPSVDMDISLPPAEPEQPTKAKSPAELSPKTKPTSKDVDMVDAPVHAQIAKVAREREDDDDDEPLAKRTKTEEVEEPNGSHAATPAASQNGANGTPRPSDYASRPISHHQMREINRILKNILKTQAGKNFKAPVAVLWPAFAESYAARIPNEIDLGTMEKKLRNGTYKTINDLRADLDLLYDNAVTFNGEDHLVAKAANDVRMSMFEKLANLPPEPPAVAKPVKKAKRPTPPVVDTAPRAPVARRPSRGSTSAVAPASTTAAPTFALDPVTSTPLIRRDSTKDGRPKREIHPPKNKDLPYSSMRPKSKKFSTELKWCEEVLAELKKPKHYPYSNPFLQPVDPVALQIPNYFTVIKQPMDISVVSEKLHNGSYSRAKEFESDVRLIFQNCFKFNPEGNGVRTMGKEFEEVFNTMLTKKDKWIAEHQPQAATPEREAESEEEESEEEAQPAPGPPPTSQFTERLVEEQNKLINMLDRGDDADLIKMQKDMISVIKKRVDEAAAAAAAAAAASKKSSSKKAKSAKPAKKAVPAKKTPSGPAKKTAGPRRERYMGTLEKEVISSGIGALPENISNEVMTLIRADQPNIAVSFPSPSLDWLYLKLINPSRPTMMEPSNLTST
ncbi:transcription initiation at TATA-containing promoter protein [Clarireedia jacksonii]